MKIFFYSNKLENRFDSVLFFLVIFFVSEFTVHGKSLSSFFFNGSSTLFKEEYLDIFSLIGFLFISLCYVLLKLSDIPIGFKIILVSVVGLFGAGSSLCFSPSPLVFFLLLYVYIIASTIVVLTPYLKLKMDREFWKIMLETGLGVARFILMVFVAAVAVARYVSGSLGESTQGFISTLAYPVIILITSFFMGSFWILLPCWNNMVQGYKKAEKFELPNKRG